MRRVQSNELVATNLWCANLKNIFFIHQLSNGCVRIEMFRMPFLFFLDCICIATPYQNNHKNLDQPNQILFYVTNRVQCTYKNRPSFHVCHITLKFSEGYTWIFNRTIDTIIGRRSLVAADDDDLRFHNRSSVFQCANVAMHSRSGKIFYQLYSLIRFFLLLLSIWLLSSRHVHSRMHFLCIVVCFFKIFEFERARVRLLYYARDFRCNVCACVAKEKQYAKLYEVQ